MKTYQTLFATITYIENSILSKSIVVLLKKLDTYSGNFVRDVPNRFYTEYQYRMRLAKMHGLESSRHLLICVLHLCTAARLYLLRSKGSQIQHEKMNQDFQ